MRLYICVDDTDDLTKSTSTGKIADAICKEVCKLGGTRDKGITRHQLLLHEDIDYTSHNSSMCMVVDLDDSVKMEDVMRVSEVALKADMAESSDPGICFCRADQLKHPERLVAYGKRAQKEVIQKQEAYDLAAELGIELHEYGGTGCGVIGALAGVGLRLSGSDGVFRGGASGDYENQTHSVAEWKNLLDIEQFVDFDGNLLSDDDMLFIGEKLKLSMIDNKITVVSKKAKDGNGYRACKKKELYEGDRRITSWTTACKWFCQDNDIEECYDENENACFNCLYRRWTAEGYICVSEKK